MSRIHRGQNDTRINWRREKGPVVDKRRVHVKRKAFLKAIGLIKDPLDFRVTEVAGTNGSIHSGGGTTSFGSRTLPEKLRDRLRHSTTLTEGRITQANIEEASGLSSGSDGSGKDRPQNALTIRSQIFLAGFAMEQHGSQVIVNGQVVRGSRVRTRNSLHILAGLAGGTRAGSLGFEQSLPAGLPDGMFPKALASPTRI